MALGTAFTTWALHSVGRPSRIKPNCFSHTDEILIHQSQSAVGNFDCSCAGFERSNSSLIRFPTELVAVPQSRIFGHWFLVVSNGVSSISTVLVIGTIILIHTWNLFGIRWDREQKILRFKLRKRTTELLFVKSMLGLLALLGFGLNICLTESYILQHPGLPTGENKFAIGQWSTWVNAVLVLISACFPQLDEKW